MSSERLEKAENFLLELAQGEPYRAVVVRHGYIAAEWIRGMDSDEQIRQERLEEPRPRPSPNQAPERSAGLESMNGWASAHWGVTAMARPTSVARPSAFISLSGPGCNLSIRLEATVLRRSRAKECRFRT